jgi:hypothetical protein
MSRTRGKSPKSLRHAKSSQDRVNRFFEVCDNVPVSLQRLEHAFAACLTPEELFLAIRQKEKLTAQSRHVLFNALENLSSASSVRQLAAGFASDLMNAERKTYRDAQNTNYCLERLFGLLSRKAQIRVASFWLADKYADSKKRFLRLAGDIDASNSTQAIFDHWRSTRDQAAAKHLIYDAPLSWLVKHAEAFLAAELAPWMTARLLLRLSKREPNIIERIRNSDQISYLYLCAKTGRRLDQSQILDLFFSSIDDHDRRGLALWAIGTLKHWQALEAILKEAAGISSEDEARILTRYPTRHPSGGL